MCRSKVQNGVVQGLIPGRDAAATPGCVTACLWNAIHFGDADDPASDVSGLIRDNKVFRLNEQLGTEPSIYYLNADPQPMP
jgi:Fe-S-cluster-containing dehydrogenase component